jgi:hypothetical protein
MKNEYDFTKMKGTPNHYAHKINDETKVRIEDMDGNIQEYNWDEVPDKKIICLDFDLVKYFDSSEEVNDILRWVRDNHPEVLNSTRTG